MAKAPDLTGQRFGSWLVLGLDRVGGGRSYWNTQCDCGRPGVIRGDSLRAGGSLQCIPCQREKVGRFAARKHGGYHSLAWKSWPTMRERCTNPNTKGFEHWGGLGIRVCARWDDFASFLADMGERPSPRHSIDRIDVNGHYEPGNCRWADTKAQARNRRNTTWIEANGKRQSVGAWAEEVGLAHMTLYMRLKAGWPHDKIVNTPLLPRTCPKPRGRRPRHPNSGSEASA